MSAQEVRSLYLAPQTAMADSNAVCRPGYGGLTMQWSASRPGVERCAVDRRSGVMPVCRLGSGPQGYRPMNLLGREDKPTT
ncbi:MAG TPA: hypothetical protein VNL35_16860 [Chloroflexota bacterium]|nr:hypothetical protein [Chloroflexota bacterium]